MKMLFCEKGAHLDSVILSLSKDQFGGFFHGSRRRLCDGPPLGQRRLPTELTLPHECATSSG
ncbi:hypothetical protein OAG63_00290 [Methylacidiphilales bacterium]|nr:hypothetical protein [Candidatus Methylacidiphilales bacterium]